MKAKYNSMQNLDNLSKEIYNDRDFAESYSNKIEYNSHNAHYERPATLSLLPDVKGKKILDAGCGPGNYADWLANKGAIVTAVDYSDEMIRLGKEKAGDKVNFVTANLNHLLEFKNDEFEIIISSMVVHYIKDWRNLFSEFNRILKPGGILIFSTSHPAADYIRHRGGNYHETELIEEAWPSYGIVMRSFRRPLGEIFKVLKECDFEIDEVIEPLPVEECKEKFPDAYAELSTMPWFIIFRTIKKK